MLERFLQGLPDLVAAIASQKLTNDPAKTSVHSNRNSNSPTSYFTQTTVRVISASPAGLADADHAESPKG